jgi:photosystem II stability/assembly factor-like uncharacterized protein
MRKNTFFIFIVTFLLSIQISCYSQSVWTTNFLNNVEGNEIRKLQFVNANTGYACGGGGTFIKTTNAGLNWNVINLGTTAYLPSLYFVDANTGYVGSSQPVIKKTTDGGTTWSTQPLSTSSYIADLNFINAQTGYAAGNGRQIFKTTNGGINWINIAPVAIPWGEIQFVNDNTGFVITDFDLYKTTNAGVNWTSILHNFGMQTGYFQDYYFLNQNTGWVTIPNGIAKTTNGGETWNFKITPIQSPTSVIFLDDNRGWVAGRTGSSGMIMATANSGTTWTTQHTVPNNFYWDISFANINTGWACGVSIISTTSTGGLVSVSQISSFVPDAFSLKQNYPNPFNPATKISFNIKNATFASLKVFDMTGKEVKNLVNENVGAGSYEIDFDGSELNSGVYFYTLKTNEFTETKKMMLVK